jgi:flagellar motor switch protein FliN
MSGTSKYTFDVEFREEGDLVSNAARARQKKVYTTEEIDQLSARAREQGMKAGQVRAAEALAAETVKLVALLREMLERSRRATDEVRQEASMLALAAARKLATAAIDQLPAADVEMTLRGALHQAIGEPRVVLNASEKVVSVLKPQFEEIAKKASVRRHLRRPSPRRLPHRTARGGAERSESAIEEAIADLIARRFSNLRLWRNKLRQKRQRRPVRLGHEEPQGAPAALLNGDSNTESETKRTAQDLEAVYDVPVTVSAVLGKSAMEVSQLLKLGKGTIVELDRKVGEAIDIYVNDRLVARGEVVLVEDRLGVTMTEIIKTGQA